VTYSTEGLKTVSLTVTGPDGSDDEVKQDYISVALEVPWAKSYGGSNVDRAYSIQHTSDGGYIVAGHTRSFGASSYDFWVLKLTSDGTVSWQKTYGGANEDHARSIRQTSDGGYIVAGYTNSFGAGVYEDFWVLKLNSDGAVVWQKTYGGGDIDRAYSIHQTADGGYIVAGETYSFGAGYNDFWILKLNGAGAVAWQKRYGGASWDYANSIQQTGDGGYIVGGVTYSFGEGGYDFWVLKLGSSGIVSWQKTYGGTNNDHLNSIQQTSDGGYIAAGYTYSFGAGDCDLWVLKLDSVGAISWQKRYGGANDDYAGTIQQSDGGYTVSGTTGSFGTGGNDVWVLKLDSAGTVSWQKAYGGIGSDEPESLQQIGTGAYILAGSADSFGAGLCDFWVLKLDSDGTISFDLASGAYVIDTDAVPADTSVSAADTTETAAITSATMVNTSAAVADTNATVMQQTP
jgi:uncharacterized delta-60 repeat protein